MYTTSQYLCVCHKAGGTAIKKSLKINDDTPPPGETTVIYIQYASSGIGIAGAIIM